MAVQIDRVTATTTAADSTFTGVGGWVTVTNLDAGGIIYFRCDGTTAAAADENHAVAAIAGLSKTVRAPKDKTVSVYATAATVCTVELHDRRP